MKYQEYKELSDAMEQAAHKFYQLRYQMSNGGNLSVRLPGRDLMLVKGTDVAFDEVGHDWMLVKATDVAFDEVCADTIVVTDFDGNLIEGNRKPSKEALLHGAIYRELPEVCAIMHCHSPYATAWADKHETLDFSTHHSEMKLGGNVPVFDTHSYAVPKEYFPMILEEFRKNKEMNAFLLRGHGQVTVAGTMREAAYLAELVEETAQISLLAGR